jgi:acetyl esterase/lipase
MPARLLRTRLPDTLAAMRAIKNALCACLLLAFSNAWAQTNVLFTRTEDVVYGRKFGTALTLDVLRPAKQNGLGVIALISGGWFSAHEGIKPDFFQPLMAHGYTVFAVVHGSQPRYIVSEIEGDIHRAVRFIRHNAAKYSVDPNRLGITGASAGGHLSLTMATQGAVGKPNAKDPIEQESSEVQCVACFFPPTDFLNYGQPGEDAVGVGVLKELKAAFGPLTDKPDGRQKLGRQVSPIYFVHSNMPPILIMHGDADKVVPISQSQMFVKRCEEAGSPVKLITREGKVHGWAGMDKDMEIFADWFDQHLRAGMPQN